MAKSYAMEVIADNSGQWCGNSVRLATRKEAEEYGQDKMMAWTAVRDVRVVETEDPVNYSYKTGTLVAVKPEGS